MWAVVAEVNSRCRRGDYRWWRGKLQAPARQIQAGQRGKLQAPLRSCGRSCGLDPILGQFNRVNTRRERWLLGLRWASTCFPCPRRVDDVPGGVSAFFHLGEKIRAPTTDARQEWTTDARQQWEALRSGDADFVGAAATASRVPLVREAHRFVFLLILAGTCWERRTEARLAVKDGVIWSTSNFDRARTLERGRLQGQMLRSGGAGS